MELYAKHKSSGSLSWLCIRIILGIQKQFTKKVQFNAKLKTN